MIKASNEKCPAANHKYMYLNGCLFIMAFTEVGFRFGTFQTGSNFNISVRRLENNISPGQKLCGEYYSHSYIILNISPPSAQNHLDFSASETTRSPLVLPARCSSWRHNIWIYKNITSNIGVWGAGLPILGRREGGGGSEEELSEHDSEHEDDEGGVDVGGGQHLRLGAQLDRGQGVRSPLRERTRGRTARLHHCDGHYSQASLQSPSPSLPSLLQLHHRHGSESRSSDCSVVTSDKPHDTPS